ncbi:MAG TPA: aminopeptidase [Gemmatimonadaceae bacterium]|nr:aminopeptidase [Gemmatimonadaceae bacterium]
MVTRRRLLSWARRAALALVVLAVGFLTLVPIGRYLARAAFEEGKILARRRPIAALIAEPTTDPALRAKLQLVLDARRFAIDSLGLRAQEEFTTYSRLDRDTLVLVLSAAYRDSLAFRSWWFPVVGRVPYKGFFDFEAGKREAKDVDAAGFDAVLRPASAFSTLGWFNDPLLPTTLSLDTLELANTIIHELVHTTYYAPGEAVFNESLANFVGSRGAERFFRARGQERAASEVVRRWDDERVYGVFWSALYASVDSAFKAHPGDRAARLVARDTVFARARQRLRTELAPRLSTMDSTAIARVRLNTAVVMARRIYLTDLDLFEQVLQRLDGDLRATTGTLIELSRGEPKAPFMSVRRFLESSIPPGVPAAP